MREGEQNTVAFDRPVGDKLQLSDFYQLNGRSGRTRAPAGHLARLLTADSSPPTPTSSLPRSSVVRGATRAPFNASYLPVMSRRLRRFTFRFFTFCTVLSPLTPTLPAHPYFHYSLCRSPTPPPPPPLQAHGNVLRNYSEVNRAGCRNEITAAGLSARAREAIRQQEMARRLNQPPTPHPPHRRLPHATIATADLHPHAVPPCGKVMQLRS